MKLDLQSLKRIHIVGIGGAGMSAIARVLKGRGMEVRGSDQKEGRLVAALRDEGIPVMVGHTEENVTGADLVLASSAVPDDNVELVAARKQGIPVMRRPEFLSPLTEGYEVIAVAGAHGKTTVTGMLVTILLEAGLDPTYIVGGVVENLGTNGQAGCSRLFVIEADEYRNT
ncbi:MAG: Mur ligase domain-containing protein, partial [Anaerolineae bacterium]